jgi:hypothetical protein
MNTSRFSTPTSALQGLWHRFNLWRAKRMYREILDLRDRAEWLKQEADELIRKHAEDPQRELPLND